MSTNVPEILKELIARSKRVKSQNEERESHSLKELIAALKELAAIEASAEGDLGVRKTRMLSPGSWE